MFEKDLVQVKKLVLLDYIISKLLDNVDQYNTVRLDYCNTVDDVY